MGAELSITVHVTRAISLRSQMLLVHADLGQSSNDDSLPVHSTSLIVIGSRMPLVSNDILPARALTGLKVHVS